MPRITFSLALPPWLAQWYRSRCGGDRILKLPKFSLESVMIQHFSRKKTEAQSPDIPGPDDIIIEIPENKVKPAEIYSFIPAGVKVMLYKTILEIFDMQLMEDIVRPFNRAKGLKKDLIYSWMKMKNIEIDETNYLGVEKRFDRLRKRMLSAERVKKSRKKTSKP